MAPSSTADSDSAGCAGLLTRRRRRRPRNRRCFASAGCAGLLDPLPPKAASESSPAFGRRPCSGGLRRSARLRPQAGRKTRAPSRAGTAATWCAALLATLACTTPRRRLGPHRRTRSPRSRQPRRRELRRVRPARRLRGRQSAPVLRRRERVEPPHVRRTLRRPLLQAPRATAAPGDPRRQPGQSHRTGRRPGRRGRRRRRVALHPRRSAHPNSTGSTKPKRPCRRPSTPACPSAVSWPARAICSRPSLQPRPSRSTRRARRTRSSTARCWAPSPTRPPASGFRTAEATLFEVIAATADEHHTASGATSANRDFTGTATLEGLSPDTTLQLPGPSDGAVRAAGKAAAGAVEGSLPGGPSGRSRLSRPGCQSRRSRPGHPSRRNRRNRPSRRATPSAPPPTPGTPGTFTIAFGGCAGYTPANERMWDTIAGHTPHAFLILGDNVYIDLPEQPGPFHDYTYYQRQSAPRIPAPGERDLRLRCLGRPRRRGRRHLARPLRRPAGLEAADGRPVPAQLEQPGPRFGLPSRRLVQVLAWGR